MAMNVWIKKYYVTACGALQERIFVLLKDTRYKMQVESCAMGYGKRIRSSGRRKRSRDQIGQALYAAFVI